jgi:hypothetical protein
MGVFAKPFHSNGCPSCLHDSGFQQTCLNSVTCRLKAGIVEPEETHTARKRLGTHVLAAINTLTTIEELLKSGIFCWVPPPRLYNKDPRPTKRMTETELVVGSQLSSARETQKRWRYS